MSVKIVSFNDSSSNSNFDNLEDYNNLKEDNIQLNFDNYNDNYNDYELFNIQEQNQIQEINKIQELNQNQNQYKINQSKSKTKIKRDPNAISYDDILNSLGFGVNTNGLYKKNTAQQSNFQTIHQSNLRQEQNFQQKKSLDPSVKNSAIYNKYFKNYKDHNEEIQHVIPLTPQQMKIKMLKDYIERQQAKKRIEQIKSKKLFYTSPNINARPQQIQIQQPVNLNKLFMFPTGRK
jgi:hypothetical protein